MFRQASMLAAAALVVAAGPALAREERRKTDVAATRLDQAILTLSRQTGASIGFRDARIGSLHVRPVSGHFTAGEALARMLQGSDAKLRRVASNSYLIEAAPRPGKPHGVRPSAPPTGSRSGRDAPQPEPAIDIIVTATKRDVPLHNYPGMVHVIEGDRLSVAQGRQGTDALAATTASVVSTHLGPGRNKLFIRGIADSSFLGPTQATVGQYWGNSRITYAAPDPSLKLFDVGRVEVLEGPQGTLYGAGSLGGIVRVVPQAPRLDATEGAAWAGIEAVSHGQAGVDGGMVVNAPIVEGRLAARAVVFASAENGYVDDIGRELKDVNDVDSFGGRLGLRFAPSDDLTFDAGLVRQRIDGADSQYAERNLGRLVRSSSIAQPFRNDFTLVDLVARKQWNDWELTVSAAYADQYVSEKFEGLSLTDARNALIGPAIDATQTDYSQTTRADMFTGEVRLARNLPGGKGWLVAASYLHNDAQALRQTDIGGESVDLTGVRNAVDEATLYGEASFALDRRLSATIGGRFTASRLSGRALNPVVPEIVLSLDPGAGASRTETQFLPSAALAYDAGRRLTLFARYQEGFRPGGIAVRREFVQRFKSDKVSGFEGGVRYGGDALKLEASLSYTDWRDIQADVIDGYGFPTTTNIGNGRVFSMGVSARWRPLPRLELEGAVYLNESEVSEAAAALATAEGDGAGRFSTDRLPNIADAVAHAGFSWWSPVGDGMEIELSGHARFVGKSILGVGSLLGRLQGDYVDTGVEAQLIRGNFRFSLAITNLLDATGNRFALGSPFQLRDNDQITPLKPRAVRLGLQYSY